MKAWMKLELVFRIDQMAIPLSFGHVLGLVKGSAQLVRVHGQHLPLGVAYALYLRYLEENVQFAIQDNSAQIQTCKGFRQLMLILKERATMASGPKSVNNIQVLAGAGLEKRVLPAIELIRGALDIQQLQNLPALFDSIFQTAYKGELYNRVEPFLNGLSVFQLKPSSISGVPTSVEIASVLLNICCSLADRHPPEAISAIWKLFSSPVRDSVKYPLIACMHEAIVSQSIDIKTFSALLQLKALCAKARQQDITQFHQLTDANLDPVAILARLNARLTSQHSAQVEKLWRLASSETSVESDSTPMESFDRPGMFEELSTACLHVNAIMRRAAFDLLLRQPAQVKRDEDIIRLFPRCLELETDPAERQRMLDLVVKRFEVDEEPVLGCWRIVAQHPRPLAQIQESLVAVYGSTGRPPFLRTAHEYWQALQPDKKKAAAATLLSHVKAAGQMEALAMAAEMIKEACCAKEMLEGFIGQFEAFIVQRFPGQERLAALDRWAELLQCLNPNFSPSEVSRITITLLNGLYSRRGRDFSNSFASICQMRGLLPPAISESVGLLQSASLTSAHMQPMLNILTDGQRTRDEKTFVSHLFESLLERFSKEEQKSLVKAQQAALDEEQRQLKVAQHVKALTGKATALHAKGLLELLDCASPSADGATVRAQVDRLLPQIASMKGGLEHLHKILGHPNLPQCLRSSDPKPYPNPYPWAESLLQLCIMKVKETAAQSQVLQIALHLRNNFAGLSLDPFISKIEVSDLNAKNLEVLSDILQGETSKPALEPVIVACIRALMARRQYPKAFALLDAAQPDDDAIWIECMKASASLKDCAIPVWEMSQQRLKYKIFEQRPENWEICQAWFAFQRAQYHLLLALLYGSNGDQRWINILDERLRKALDACDPVNARFLQEGFQKMRLLNDLDMLLSDIPERYALTFDLFDVARNKIPFASDPEAAALDMKRARCALRSKSFVELLKAFEILTEFFDTLADGRVNLKELRELVVIAIERTAPLLREHGFLSASLLMLCEHSRDTYNVQELPIKLMKALIATDSPELLEFATEMGLQRKINREWIKTGGPELFNELIKKLWKLQIDERVPVLINHADLLFNQEIRIDLILALISHPTVLKSWFEEACTYFQEMEAEHFDFNPSETAIDMIYRVLAESNVKLDRISLPVLCRMFMYHRLYRLCREKQAKRSFNLNHFENEVIRQLAPIESQYGHLQIDISAKADQEEVFKGCRTLIDRLLRVKETQEITWERAMALSAVWKGLQKCIVDFTARHQEWMGLMHAYTFLEAAYPTANEARRHVQDAEFLGDMLRKSVVPGSNQSVWNLHPSSWIGLGIYLYPQNFTSMKRGQDQTAQALKTLQLIRQTSGVFNTTRALAAIHCACRHLLHTDTPVCKEWYGLLLSELAKREDYSSEAALLLSAVIEDAMAGKKDAMKQMHMSRWSDVLTSLNAFLKQPLLGENGPILFISTWNYIDAISKCRSEPDVDIQKLAMGQMRPWKHRMIDQPRKAGQPTYLRILGYLENYRVWGRLMLHLNESIKMESQDSLYETWKGIWAHLLADLDEMPVAEPNGWLRRLPEISDDLNRSTKPIKLEVPDIWINAFEFISHGRDVCAAKGDWKAYYTALGEAAALMLRHLPFYKQHVNTYHLTVCRMLTKECDQWDQVRRETAAEEMRKWLELLVEARSIPGAQIAYLFLIKRGLFDQIFKSLPKVGLRAKEHLLRLEQMLSSSHLQAISVIEMIEDMTSKHRQDVMNSYQIS